MPQKEFETVSPRKYTSRRANELLQEMFTETDLGFIEETSKLLIKITEPYDGKYKDFATDPRRVLVMSRKPIKDSYDAFVSRLSSFNEKSRISCSDQARLIIAVLLYAEETLTEVRNILQFISRNDEHILALPKEAWTPEILRELYGVARDVIHTLIGDEFSFNDRARANACLKQFCAELNYKNISVREVANKYLSLYNPITNEEN